MFRRRRRSHDDFAQEVEAHIQLEADRLHAKGLTESDALAQARRAFGNPTSAKERFYESTRSVLFEQLRQDVRYAWRSLSRNPVLFAVAIASLALAISASTAAFSLADALLVRSLPVRDPQQLRILNWSEVENPPVKNMSGYAVKDSQSGKRLESSFSWRAAELFASGVPEFSDVARFSLDELTVTTNESSEYVNGSYVSGTFFRTVGVETWLGRTIAVEDEPPGVARVAVLSHGLWSRRFHQDPKVLGTSISVNKTPVTIIGVLPAKFTGIEPGRSADLYIPLWMAAEFDPTSRSRTVPTTWWVQILGRLRPGASDAAAVTSAQRVLRQAIQEYAALKEENVPPVVARHAARGVTLASDYMASYVYILSALVLVILLIACTNLANLLFSRAVARSRDTAVRLSLGASRRRILRQTTTEAMIIALAGTILGCLLATPAIRILAEWIGADQNSLPHVWADLRVMSFAAALCLFTAFAASVVPGWRASRLDPASSLKAAHVIGAGGGEMRFTRILIPVQVALSLLLLVAAGLFGRTFIQLASVDLGFRPERVLTFDTDAGHSGYTAQRINGVYEEIGNKLASIPGVESVGLSHLRLLTGGMTGDSATIPGRPVPATGNPTSVLYCSDTFLSTMGIPILLGSGLSSDGRSAELREAVVNEAFAKRNFGDENPIGQVFTFGSPNRKDELIHVVGVSGNAHYTSVREEPPPTVYLSYKRTVRKMSFAIRTALPASSIADAIRKAVASVDPSIAVARLETQEELVNKSISVERMFAMLVSGFGLLASLLSAIGLYALMTWSASRRTPEIGIRIALGAPSYNVQWLVVRQSLMLAGVGVVMGAFTAVVLSKYVGSLLYNVQPKDTWSFVAAIFAMALVVTAAAWVPARRASRVNAMTALRAD
jgi:predicted permease